MQIWKKVKLKNIDKQTALLSNALTNYIYKEGPIINIFNKYDVSREDRAILDNYISSRIAGLILLFFGGDSKRINDIANKYNYLDGISNVMDIDAEIEGYVHATRSNREK